MIRIHACPAILSEIEKAAQALHRNDIVVEALCGGPEAASCVLTTILRDDDLHILAGSCSSQTKRLPPHLHIVKWLSCYEALAGNRDIERWLDEGAHLLTPSMMDRQEKPIWRRWGFDRVEDAAEFARDGMTRLVYLDTGDSPARREAAEHLAREFGLQLVVQPTDLDRLTLWLKSAIHDAENGRELRLLRRLNSELMILSDITSRLLATETLAETVTDVETELGIMIGAKVQIDLDAAAHAAKAMTGAEFDIDHVLTTQQEAGATLIASDADFNVTLLYGPCTVGKIAVSDIQFAERIDEYGDAFMRLAPAVVMAAVVQYRRQRNRKTEALLAEIFRNSPSGILLLDLGGRILRSNEAARNLLGADESTLARTPIDAFRVRGLSGEHHDPISRMRDVGFLRDRFEIEGLDGAHRLVSMVLRKTQFHGDDAPKVIAIINDVKERIALERSMRKAQAFFDATSEGIVVTDNDAIILDVNGSFTAITGYSREDVLGKTPRILKSGVHDDEFYGVMWTSLKAQGFWRGQIWNRRKSGEIYPELLNINALKDETGENFGYVAVFSDITTIKRSEDELRHLAFHDTLTDLPNRIQLRSDLQRGISLIDSTKGALALLFVDLDGFKDVNDTHGHHAGDELLRQVAQLLKSLVRRSDTAARIGGDEFILLVGDLPRMDAAEYARSVVEKIIGTFDQPFDILGKEVRITCSIGVSICPDHGSDVTTLMQKADAALYKAKQAGKNTYRFVQD